MPATPGNALNITAAGIVIFDGTATFTATTTTQFDTLVGGASNTIVSIAPGTSGQVLTSAGAGANPAYAAIPFTKMPWTDKATSFAVASNNGYFVTANATATLPAAPAQGDVVSFAVDNATAILTITGNTGQIIRVGKDVSAAAGTCVSNFNGDSITLVYRTSDTAWIAVGAPEGTWTIT